MKGGGEVAVKVQRAGLKALFDQDLQVIQPHKTMPQMYPPYSTNTYTAAYLLL